MTRYWSPGGALTRSAPAIHTIVWHGSADRSRYKSLINNGRDGRLEDVFELKNIWGSVSPTTMTEGVQLSSLASPLFLRLISQSAHLFQSGMHLATLSNYITDWIVLCDTLPRPNTGVKAYDVKTLQNALENFYG